jgi:hypothetical protein
MESELTLFESRLLAIADYNDPYRVCFIKDGPAPRNLI